MSEVLDSGNRREFETGAVRDIAEGKGRCDLLPLDVLSGLLASRTEEDFYLNIELFKETGKIYCLKLALEEFLKRSGFQSGENMLLEVSKQFEDGAKKYGENNWKKGIPAQCYVDSAVRHYLKWSDAWNDEPHDRAVAWNLICCIWTCKHKPELNTYLKVEENNE